jgi:hypothetical protein
LRKSAWDGLNFRHKYKYRDGSHNADRREGVGGPLLEDLAMERMVVFLI